jgi:hypothetical protein
MNAKTPARIASVLAPCLVLLALPGTGTAQWSVEGRVGAAVPLGDLGDDAQLAQTGGLGFGGDVMYTIQDYVSVYGGASHQRYTCDGCPARVISTGLQSGLKLLFDPTAPMVPWARAGLLYHRPDVGGVEGDWHLGLDTGLGVDVRVGPGWFMVPAVRYKTYDADDMSLNDLTIDFGLLVRFGGGAGTASSAP